MAKVTFGPLVTEARGKVGDVVFSRTRGGAISRAAPVRVDPYTTIQTDYQDIFKAGALRWNANLTDDQRKRWREFSQLYPRTDQLAQGYAPSGQCRHAGSNAVAYRYGGGFLDDPPANLDCPQPTNVEILAATETPQLLSVRMSGSLAAAGGTLQTTPLGAYWDGIAWSPALGLFAAVSYSSTTTDVITSPDGINWTPQTTPAGQFWAAIAWSPALGLFAAVSYSSTTTGVITSPDGINWTPQTSHRGQSWQSIAWSPALGLFAAVSYSSTATAVMTSPDGITWTLQTTPAGGYWTAIAWSPALGLFAAVSYSSTATAVMTSPNGINWTPQTTPAGEYWSAIAWAPSLGLFAAVSDSTSTTAAMTSPDGINWTPQTTPADEYWAAIEWSPALGLFAAVSFSGSATAVMTSPDGINWKIQTTPADQGWQSIAWSPALALFAAVSDSGSATAAMTYIPPTERWVLSATKQLNPGMHNVAEWWTPLTYGHNALPYDYDATAEYVALHGALVAGKKIHVRLQFANATTGVISRPVSTSALVLP
jgi:hypothetical protein